MSRLVSSTNLYRQVTLTKVRHETPAVKTLVFARPFDFVAGEYITVYFDDLAPEPPKAYSISAPPYCDEISITVRDIGGPYSSRLCSLEQGDCLSISDAYGYFNPRTSRPLVVLAAGVGISPAWSVVKDELARDSHRQIAIYATNKTVDEIVFHHELCQVENEHDSVAVKHFITQEPAACSAEHGRIDCVRMASEFPGDGHFLVCGSESFVRDMYAQLREINVDDSRIATETFFMSKKGQRGNTY
jgi:ferredoxin-NADP reductase